MANMTITCLLCEAENGTNTLDVPSLLEEEETSGIFYSKWSPEEHAVQKEPSPMYRLWDRLSDAAQENLRLVLARETTDPGTDRVGEKEAEGETG
jgi:hypothetical protein